jgi:hypothetical protein
MFVGGNGPASFDVHFFQSEGFRNAVVHGQFATQHPVETTAIDTMTPSKRALPSFAFHCRLEAPNDVVVVKQNW